MITANRITMDSQNRLCITENIRKIVSVDFKREVRIYLNMEDNNKLLLSNDLNLPFPCFGSISFDDRFRFYFPKELRKYLGITDKTILLTYSMQDQLVIQVIHKV